MQPSRWRRQSGLPADKQFEWHDRRCGQLVRIKPTTVIEGAARSPTEIKATNVSKAEAMANEARSEPRPCSADDEHFSSRPASQQNGGPELELARRRRALGQRSSGPGAFFTTCDGWSPAAVDSKLVVEALVRQLNKRHSHCSLAHWFLLGLLPLLLLNTGAVPEPGAGSLVIRASAQNASLAAGVEGSSASPPPPATANSTDEFSRAVLATMSTQAPGLQLNASEARASSSGPLPADASAQPLVSSASGQTTALGGGGAADSPASIYAATHEHLDDETGLVVEAPTPPSALMEPESSDDLVAGQQLPGSPGLHDDDGDMGGQMRVHQTNDSSADEAAAGKSGAELASYYDKFIDFARIFAMVTIMIGNICGNSLVILSVMRHSKLRVNTNWFVVSLACADILVAVFAMTFNASVQITGKWVFPRWMCDFWNSCDVLASTASILHLCCISIHRYYAIMHPLDCMIKITTRRVCYALAVVWFSSALLSYIPIFTGIYTTSEHIKWQQANPDQCEFVVNRVYAIVSSSISFWIPCCIMVFTYYKIYQEATRQEKFIYKAQNMLPAPQANHQHQKSGARSKQGRSKSMAITSLSSSSNSNQNQGKRANEARIKQFAAKQSAAEASATGGEQSDNSATPAAKSNNPTIDVQAPPGAAGAGAEQQPLTGSAIDLNNNQGEAAKGGPLAGAALSKQQQQQQQQQEEEQDERDSNSGQSTPTKRSISKMKREHKAAKTLGIIMGVFILCWLPFFSWYTPQHICGHACDGIVPHNVVSLLFWIGYFNSTLNPIIYAYFNHEFRDAFKKTLQWIFCCCRDLKCLRVNRPNDNQHYNCTYRSTQEIGLVTNG